MEGFGCEPRTILIICKCIAVKHAEDTYKHLTPQGIQCYHTISLIFHQIVTLPDSICFK
jgi:hypothetical protein